MGDGTGIEWTDTTWNPIRGCSRVSEGCLHCYAEQQAARTNRQAAALGRVGPYEGLVKIVKRDVRQFAMVDGKPTGNFRTVTVDEPRWTGVVRMVPEHLADPLRWRKPRRIFVNSMSDLFHESLSNEQIAAVFGVMAAAPQHTFQVLTKHGARGRLDAWFRWVEREAAKAGPGAEVMLCVNCADEHDVFGERLVISPPWPLPNVWLGVSVENQAAADERIPELLATPAAVRFLSCEPLLGPVDLSPYLVDDLHRSGRAPRIEIDWVIAGCESGPGARPAESAWYRSLRDQCAAAGAPFFLKQAREEGTWLGDNEHEQTVLEGRNSHRKPGGIIGAPYLDGKQHLAFPEVGRGR